MDQEYDFVVLGTGLSECVLSGLLSLCGKKVLHTDRNSYYGGESTSLNLKELYAKFGKGEPPSSMGNSRDWNIDLILKLIMSEDRLVQMFRCSKVYQYMSFLQISGSYVYRDGKLHKVPATEKEVLSSGLLGLFQKKHLHSLFSALANCDISKKQVPPGLDPVRTTVNQMFDKYSLNDDNKELIGHAIALHQDDSYLQLPCYDIIERIDLYRRSLEAYGKSPYIYPQYGLGEVPQSFARLCAVYGGTYMLSTPATGVDFDAQGKVCSVRYGDKVVKTSAVIGDPSYFPERVKSTKKVVRCICLLNHPVQKTDGCQSCQIIIPSRQSKRTSDIYISVLSSEFQTSPPGYYVAIVCTYVECSNPEDDIKLGLSLLDPILERFITVQDLYEPITNGINSRVFISKSYDGTTHYENTCKDIVSLWKDITGEDFNEKTFAEKTHAIEDL